MADYRKQIPENVTGDFFVDTTCIDCDACRQLAPETFGDASDSSYVRIQPQTDEQVRSALRALVSCPTGSIGTRSKQSVREAITDFPMLLEDGVYYCGFNSPKSYGGSSYFIRHPKGNWLIDSPKFLPPLVRRIEELGGIQYIFLTHRDDVAEAERFAARFCSKRIIHRTELSAQPGAEIIIDGFEPRQFSDEFIIIPTPGHTRGHCVLLYKNNFLFTGDHLWWSRTRKALSASRSVCWYSWSEQTASMKKLHEYDFTWVVPGHGERIKLPQDEMKWQLSQLIARM